MSKLIRIKNANDLLSFELAEGVPAFDIKTLDNFSPDAHWILVDGKILLGRISLWWTKPPAYGTHHLGIIGHYAVNNEVTSRQLLDHACAELKINGCTLAVGPMNGNTMQKYRFLIERGDEKPFLLEPDNPDEWPEYWKKQGFETLSIYYSSLNEDLTYEDPRIPEVEKRLAANNIKIRNLDIDSFADELRRIYQVSAVSFQQNFLYSPFTEEEFLELYLPLRSYVKPETVLIAEDGDKPVGFIFNIPDYMQAQRQQPIDTLIVKSFAVLPGRTYAGLGNVLLAQSHRIAYNLGYKRAIHALMYEGNNSMIISNRFSRPFRRYALFAKDLQV
jgi:GNAT superfamily N-acetyltransferase